MKLWIVETFSDGKWRLLAYPNGYGTFNYPMFPIRDEARRWKRNKTAAHWRYEEFHIRRVELPGVEG